MAMLVLVRKASDMFGAIRKFMPVPGERAKPLDVGSAPPTEIAAQVFSVDYTTQHSGGWHRILSRFAGKSGIRGIEIGCFEGRSSLWFLKNVLQHPASSLTCIDPWPSAQFLTNISEYHHKVRWIPNPSSVALLDSGLSRNTYHFAYIDGDHTASGVLQDAVLVLPLLVPGGIIIFDDYQWKSETPRKPHTMPSLAIDAFMDIYQDQITLLDKGYQVVLEKKDSETGPPPK